MIRSTIDFEKGRGVPKAATDIDGKPQGGRSRRGVATRARLVQAAKEIFERDGFLDSRITDIAKQAGVSHGSFYHYFESKEQLFREVAEMQEERLTAPPENAGVASAPGESPRIRIDKANRRYLERYRDEARIMGVIEQVSRYDEPVNEGRLARIKLSAERSEKAIRRWQDEGRVDAGIDPALAADALGAMVARFAELWLVQGYREYDFDHAVQQLSRLWSNALQLTDEASPRRTPRRRS